MSDLVANLKDRFSHETAHLALKTGQNPKGLVFSLEAHVHSELCHEKTCLWGCIPGLIQTELYNHRRWLEA